MYKNIKEGYITLEKAEEIQKEFKSEISKIEKIKNKLEEQKAKTNNIKQLKHFINNKKKLSNCFIIILELYLKWNTKQNMEKASKY